MDSADSSRPDPDPRDDRALLAAHVSGDRDAFGVLVRRHRDRLWAVALRTTGDPEEAADALQDALVNAYRKAGSYRADAAVTTWLHRVVVNACLDRIRRRQVRAADPLPETEAFEAAVTARAAPVGPEAAAELAERRDRVLAALQQIPADQRAVLVLVDMEGRSVEETAQVLGIPPGTVKSRCSRGRARMAPLLADLRDHSPSPSGRNRPAPGHVVPDEGRSVP